MADLGRHFLALGHHQQPVSAAGQRAQVQIQLIGNRADALETRHDIPIDGRLAFIAAVADLGRAVAIDFLFFRVEVVRRVQDCSPGGDLHLDVAV